MIITQAFIYNGSDDWKIADVDDWNWDVVELEGDEPTMGHRKIDGSVFKVVKTSDGKLIAISK